MPTTVLGIQEAEHAMSSEPAQHSENTSNGTREVADQMLVIATTYMRRYRLVSRQEFGTIKEVDPATY